MDIPFNSIWNKTILTLNRVPQSCLVTREHLRLFVTVISSDYKSVVNMASFLALHQVLIIYEHFQI